MAVYADRTAFIPYRRSDLVELCLAEGKLNAQQSQKFREFSEILAAYYHFEFHRDLESIKESFAPFNPDSATKSIRDLTPEEYRDRKQRLVQSFENVLERANYKPISQESLQRAFNEEALIELKTDVEFDDFLLMKYKDAAYFEAKGMKLEKLKFTPGKFYVALYKNVPKSDLEFLFPNVKVSMTLKDQVMFIVPAVGAAIPILLKVLPQLLLIIGVLLLWLPNVDPPDSGLLKATEEDAENLTRLLLTIVSTLVVLGGFAFKQYSKYQNKQLKFQKSVSDTLFFRNIASNASVFSSLIDAAEEEECKEILLVYYHLLVKERP
ncbi:MAG: DUF3754 domain-containing protein, partial [Oscillatoriales cyanobacterium]